MPFSDKEHLLFFMFYNIKHIWSLQFLLCVFSPEFPKIHSSKLVQHEIIANYSILYTIKGTNTNLTPYLLMAHLDVVPADPAKWESPPFDADILNDFIYARGTIDFKHGVMVRMYAGNNMTILDSIRLEKDKKTANSFYVHVLL